MSSAWPEPVERVAAFLREAGAEARLEEFPAGTPTARDAARAVGCEERDIVKSLVFLVGERAVVALVPGDRRADPKKVASAVDGRKAKIAGPDAVESATGYAPGAVSPFGLPRGVEVLVDRTLLGRETLWAGAGSTRHIVGVSASELVRLARARPVDAVADESAY